MMLTALKRITKRKSHCDVQNKSSGPQTMPQSLQKKFSQGIQYNMKIIIKGDTCCGKTSLFHRLQAKPIGDYIPTEEIQVANVQWNYKNAEDVVKVEVWDIVDKGKKRSVPTGLKLSEVTVSLDAEFLDVYKGTDGVIIVFDITKAWTFNYVKRELLRIPDDIPVLILGNCCDMGHHRSIHEDTVRQYVDSVQRPDGQAQVRYTESSMVNGFGLRYIYKFLALPFLQLQRKTLKLQMNRNSEEIDIALDEIDAFGTDPFSNYGAFVNALNQKRRENADSLGVQLKPGETLPARTPSVIFGLGHTINRYRPFAKTPVQSQRVDPTTSGRVNSNEMRCIPTKQQIKNVEEFIPDGEHLDDQFFRETPPSIRKDLSNSPEQSDSESEEAINPLVANFQEDIELEDQYVAAPITSSSYININYSYQVMENPDYEGDSPNFSTFEIKADQGGGGSRGQMMGPFVDYTDKKTDDRTCLGPDFSEVTIRSAVLNKPLVSEQKENVFLLSKSEEAVVDSHKRTLELLGGTCDKPEGIPSNNRGLRDGNRDKYKSSTRRKKGKSNDEKRLKGSDPTDDTKTKKHKKLKDENRCRSKKKMKTREQLLSDSFKDLEELFVFEQRSLPSVELNSANVP